MWENDLGRKWIGRELPCYQPDESKDKVAVRAFSSRGLEKRCLEFEVRSVKMVRREPRSVMSYGVRDGD